MAKTMMDADVQTSATGQENHTFKADGAERINLPSGEFIADAAMTRDGDDLVLETPSGEIAVVEGYFSAEPAPLLVSSDGSALTPNLVESFAKSPLEFAANPSASDESPVGAVEEVKGNATVTRADGSVENITIGTPIYEGDIIQTDAYGAVNIVFMDETSMAISENARLAIDEYTFDPSTESGTTNFSVLRGLFVFTSGLIGRDDPDDVQIDTPVGSIGIRGTVIAGEINPGGDSKITVLEGAIVVKNGLGDITLSEQFETVQLSGYDTPMQDIGVVPANDISARFSSVGSVSPALFTTINDAAGEQGRSQQQNQPQSQQETPASETQSLDTTSQDIITLSGDTSGFGTSLGTNVVTATNTTASSLSASTSTTGHGSSAGTATLPTTLAPPEPVVSREPAPLTVSAEGRVITDTAATGSIVATLGVTGTIPAATYTFSNGTSVSDNGYYAIVGRNVVLTADGHEMLGSSLGVVQLGGFSITATDSSGRTSTAQYSVQVVDANNASNSVHMNEAHTGVSFISDNLDNQIGYSITALGDLNNDGFDDFAFTNNVTGSGNNHTYQVMGNSSSIGNVNFSGFGSTVTNPTLVGNTSETVISGVGDFDGDGIEDYVIGQMGNSITSSSGSGSAAIISGATGLAMTHNILFVGSGVSGIQIGADVDGIGDLNNDGYADVIIGAPGYGTGGSAYVVTGRGDWAIDVTANVDTGTNWQRIDMNTTADFGRSVAGLGDFNGDGYSDFVIGAPTVFSNNGAAYLYYGTSGPIPTNASYALAGGTNQGMGEEVASLGDINGDGLTDLLVGGNGNYGRIYFGSTSAVTSPNITLNIPNTYTLSGGGPVGDFNGDGYDDFAISVADATSTNTYVVFGKDFGASTTIDLAFLKNPENAFELRYNHATSADDLEISGIGDINGDGYDDFAIGVPDANGAADGNGGVAVIYGRNTGAVTTGTSATADNQAIVGGPGPNLLSDGGFDGVSLRGGAGADTFELRNTNFLGIDGGGQATGTSDKIVAMNNLDFSGVNFEKMSGIEKISFGSANQTITLTMENIFNLMKSSDGGYLKIGREGALAGANLILSDGVGGDNHSSGTEATDIEEILESHSGGSVAHSTFNDGGVNYDVFTIGGYKLLVDQAIAVDAQ